MSIVTSPTIMTVPGHFHYHDSKFGGIHRSHYTVWTVYISVIVRVRLDFNITESGAPQHLLIQYVPEAVNLLLR